MLHPAGVGEARLIFSDVAKQRRRRSLRLWAALLSLPLDLLAAWWLLN